MKSMNNKEKGNFMKDEFSVYFHLLKCSVYDICCDILYQQHCIVKIKYMKIMLSAFSFESLRRRIDVLPKYTLNLKIIETYLR